MEECANGMANQVRNGGLCIKHGVPGKLKKCDWVDRVRNLAQRGGVCTKHGSECKKCSKEGCSSLAQKGGLCMQEAWY
eukprot:scaffold4626_cov110-Skeletonema_dohrnii-CCMP3373.AAC.9